MTQIVPPTRNKSEEHGLQAWANVFKPNFRDLVSLGFVEGASLLSYGATVAALDPADGRVAFYEAELAYPTELSASTVYLCSSSASDTGVYTIQGLDASGTYATATVTATGTTPVAISGTWNHIQRVIASGAVNVGTVYVSTYAAGLPTTTGHQIQIAMLPGTSYAINPLLVCPANQIITVNRFDFSVSARTTPAKIEIEANRQGRWIQNFVFYSDGQFAQTFDSPLRLFEGDKLRCWITSGTNGSNAAFGMNGLVMTDTGVNVAKSGVWELFA